MSDCRCCVDSAVRFLKFHLLLKKIIIHCVVAVVYKYLIFYVVIVVNKDNIKPAVITSRELSPKPCCSRPQITR